MRIANASGRGVLLASDTTGYDIATASDSRFGPRLQAIYDDWAAFTDWAASYTPADEATTFTRAQLGAPSPDPKQILAIGLNYSEHATETGFEIPAHLPPVFTKFRSALTGPDTTVVLPNGGHTDWEVELVVVMGATAHQVSVADAWDHIAGLTIGQDLSERILQMAVPPAQFSFGKSYPGFAPTGPWLVTPDELPSRDDLSLGCKVDGETVQDGRTRDLIFPVAQLVAELSKVITLYPGDLIFTGTPDGVGMGRNPQRFLEVGQTLTTWIEGIGEMRQVFTD